MEAREKQTTYPEEYKKSAVKLALESDQPIIQTARDLGINKSTLNGLWIADRVRGADRELIFLFGLFHDCRRQYDGADLSHGARAAKAVTNFQESGLINLEPERMAVLVKSLGEHTFGHVSDDPTIGCCWDADRYDVLRVFDRVKPGLLSHPDVATPERLDAAYYKPGTVEQSWEELWQQVDSKI
jgi:hypothetical protein